MTCFNNTGHPLAHWLALKTAMHQTLDAPATDTPLSTTWLTLNRSSAAYVRRHGITQAQRSMSWPADTEQILNLRTTNLQAQANKLPGMHRRSEGHRPTYSIFQGCNVPKQAPNPAPKRARPKARPGPEGAGAPA